MNLTAKPCRMCDIIAGDQYFYVPDYQRPYEWEESHVEDFWTDLTKSFERKEDGYFLDKLILVNRGDNQDFEVVDGRQRLTTTLILLAVLRDFFFQHGLAELANEIQNICLKKNDKYRLCVRPEERVIFEDSILKEIGSLRTVEQNNVSSNFRMAAILLLQFVEEKNEELKIKNSQNDSTEYFQKFYRFLLDEVVLIVVTTDSLASAYTIFEVINTRGKDLETKDLLKNLLVRRLEEEVTAHNAKFPTAQNSFEGEKRRFLDTWREIEKVKTPMDELLRHHWVVLVGDRSRKDLFREISEYIKESRSPVDFFMSDWKKSVDAFSEIQSGTWLGEQLKGSVKKDLLLLKNIGHGYWLPVIIASWRRGMNKNEAEILIDGLERFCGLAFVDGYYSHGVLSSLLSAVRDVNNGQSVEVILERLELFLKKNRVYRNVAEILHGDIYHARWGRYVLAKYEYSLLDDSVIREIPFSKTVQLEHILPQTMTDPAWTALFSENEHDELVNTLGNLTLLAGSMDIVRKSKNQSASNKPFVEKVKVYRGETNQDGLSAFRMTQEVADCATWTPEIIRSRTEKIITKLFEVWRVSEEVINDVSFLKNETAEQGEKLSVHSRPDHSVGNYGEEELKTLLLITLQSNSVVAGYAKVILKVLLDSTRPLGREELCDMLFSVGLAENRGDTGRRLNKFSQLLSRTGNQHLRQIVRYSIGSAPMESKDNYYIPEEYKDMIREAINKF